MEGRKEKKRVLVLYGGRSAEHEISITSASSVTSNLDKDRFEVVAAAIDTQGRWLLHEQDDLSEKALAKTAETGNAEIVIRPGMGDKTFCTLKDETLVPVNVDVVFPVLHGTYGEDGTVQGLLEMAGVPYVGCGVLASALAMDKAAAKDMLATHQLPVTPWHVIDRTNWEHNRDEEISHVMMALKMPVFVKPCNLGSSIGITKVKDPSQLESAVKEALQYDGRIIVEQGVNAREIEVSVLGVEGTVEASVAGEVVPSREFYDFEAKYRDANSKLIIPANLPQELSDHIRDLACRAFWAIGGSGMGRVDFLVDKNSLQPFVSEINTIPGFTSISMYPKLWEATGVPYKTLLSRLVDGAVNEFCAKKSRKYRY